MKILVAMLILLSNLIILAVLFMVFYIVLKPVIYKKTNQSEIPAVFNQGTLFLITSARIMSTRSYIPSSDIVSAKITAPEGINELVMLPSSQSTTTVPNFSNFYPIIYSSLLNIEVEKGEKIIAEMVVNTITGSSTNSTIEQTTLYYEYISEESKEKYFYLAANGFNKGSIVNNVLLIFDNTGTNNPYSLRLKLPNGYYTEIANSTGAGDNSSLGNYSTFFVGQVITLFSTAGEVSEKTIEPGITKITIKNNITFISD